MKQIRNCREEEVCLKFYKAKWNINTILVIALVRIPNAIWQNTWAWVTCNLFDFNVEDSV